MLCLGAYSADAQLISKGSEIKVNEQKAAWEAIDAHFKKEVPVKEPKASPTPEPKEKTNNNEDKGGNKNDGNNLQSFLIGNNEIEMIVNV